MVSPTSSYPGRKTPNSGQRRFERRVLLSSISVALVSGAQPALATSYSGGVASIDVQIRTTSFGIPHIKAKDWVSLGYGLGYAYAQDNACILARELVVSRGDGPKYFDATGDDIPRAFVFKWLSRASNVERFYSEQPPRIRRAIQGYAAGYNRWLRDTGIANLPKACAGQPWVREIGARDLVALYLRGNTRASLSPLAGAVFSAQPPGDRAPPTETLPVSSRPMDFGELERALNISPRFRGGSNAYGLGGRTTSNGKGMLLGNPHEPWTGIDRFYQVHLQIPHRLNVMGVTQFAVPAVVIGFNEHIAWSHTISTAKRFTVFELSLDPSDPLTYFFTLPSGEVERRRIEVVPLEIEVKGFPQPVRRNLYRSHFGLMVSAATINPLGPKWGDDLREVGGPQSVAYTLRDVNEDNTRVILQWQQMGRARSVRQLRRTLSRTLGLPFVNTVAADVRGRSLYADIGVVPNVSEQQLLGCAGSPIAQLFTASGFVFLDGTRSNCDWVSAAGTPQAGILPADALPSLITRDYVTNSNDSYWLSNPEQPLTGFAPLLRRNVFQEVSARSLRTRLGIIQIRDRLNNRDGLGGTRFSLDKLQRIWYSNRNYSGELSHQRLLQACRRGTPRVDAWPTTRGSTVDVTAACLALEQWDRTDNAESIGVPVWREFYRRLGFFENFLVPFDPSSPVDTPNTLALDDQTQKAFGDAVAQLTELNFPFDARLGDVQFVTDDNGPPKPSRENVIPMHGGIGQNGVFNVLETPVTPDGYTPILFGPTYMQTVTWNRKNEVVAEAILGFSQSDDPESPNFADQTRRYSTKEFIRLPFREEAIQRDLKSKVRLRDALRLDETAHP